MDVFRVAVLFTVCVWGCHCGPLIRGETKKARLIHELEKVLQEYQNEKAVPLKVSKRSCTVVSGSGTISSPGFNGVDVYGDNLDVCWTLQAEPGKVPRITFESLDIEPATDCSYDSLEISYSNIGYVYCGGVAPGPLTATEPTATVTFTTDGSYGHTGFQLRFDSVDGDGSSSGPQQPQEPQEPQEPQAPSDPSTIECGVPGPLMSSRITGGTEASRNAWPWQIFLLTTTDQGQFKCGGSIVAPRWIITAAHCVKDNDDELPVSSFQVTVGEHDLQQYDEGEETFSVEEVFFHPEYRRATVTHDIALLKLSRAITFQRPYTVPVCLPGANVHDPAPGTMLTATGWGSTENFQGTTGDETRLNQVDLPMIGDDECRNFGGSYQFIGPTEMCAGYAEGIKGICGGDSGGPLVGRLGNNGAYYLYGLTSWGQDPCNSPDEPGVFARVTYLRDWIASTSQGEIPFA